LSLARATIMDRAGRVGAESLEHLTYKHANGRLVGENSPAVSAWAMMGDGAITCVRATLRAESKSDQRDPPLHSLILLRTDAPGQVDGEIPGKDIEDADKQQALFDILEAVKGGGEASCHQKGATR
jgi:hypothetical protein